MTKRDIIETMTKQTGIPENRLLESVLRDPRDHRFYLTYATITVCLDGIHIKPTDDVIKEYISKLPFYCDKATMDGLLTE